MIHDRVHLAAGAALAAALTTVKHEALAGRRARLQRLQARSRGRAGRMDACGCGRPGCMAGWMGPLGAEEEEAEVGAEEAGRAVRINRASSLIMSTTRLLVALKMVSSCMFGKEGWTRFMWRGLRCGRQGARLLPPQVVAGTRMTRASC